MSDKILSPEKAESTANVATPAGLHEVRDELSSKPGARKPSGNSSALPSQRDSSTDCKDWRKQTYTDISKDAQKTQATSPNSPYESFEPQHNADVNSKNQDAVIANTSGRLRFNNHTYTVENGIVFAKDSLSDIRQRVGSLQPGLIIALDNNGGNIPLDGRNDVMIDLRIHNGDKPDLKVRMMGYTQQVDGLPSNRLVNVDELVTQSLATLVDKSHDQSEYSRSAAVVTASLADWLSGGRQEQLFDLHQNMSSQVKNLTHAVNNLFLDGFDTDKIGGSTFDRFRNLIQGTSESIKSTATDSSVLLVEGKQTQSTVNQAAVMSAMTLLTSGGATAARAAAAAGAGTAAVIARSAATIIGSALVSAGLRHKAEDGINEFTVNVESGMLESATMIAAGEMSRAARLGGASLLNRSALAIRDSLASTMGFAFAARIRGDKEATDLNNIACGTASMLFGRAVGSASASLFNSGLKSSLGTSLLKSMGYIPSNAFVERLARIPSASADTFAFGAMNAALGFENQQRQRLALEKGCRPEEVKDTEVWNFNDMSSRLLTSGALAALPVAPFAPMMARWNEPERPLDQWQLSGQMFAKAADAIASNFPKDANLVLLGRDCWPLVPLLRQRGMSAQYFLWSRLQSHDTGETGAQWLKEVRPNSIVIDSGQGGSILNKIRQIDPTISGYLIHSLGSYPEVPGIQGDRRSLYRQIERFPKIIGRCSGYVRGQALCLPKAIDSDEVIMSPIQKLEAISSMLRSARLPEPSVKLYSSFTGCSPKQRMGLGRYSTNREQ